jgi:crotonobetainyl-CoA:carnitine CoA-transferase CaiB-like acyl-CoA transferase
MAALPIAAAHPETLAAARAPAHRIPEVMMAHLPASTALEDLTVLDLTRVRAGPTCVRQLADWGANVIKIEMREEEAAASGPADLAARHDPDFQNLQRNKRSLTLDLKHPDGLAIFRRLAAQADVVVENYRPDVKTRLGIDYATLQAINPRLIYASISGFGQDGPYKDRPGVDQIAQGMSGLMSVTGAPGGGPMRAGIAVGDLTAGLLAAIGILIALHERERSGQGQWVQTSLLEALLFMLDFQGARYLMKGEVADQTGNNHPTGVPTGTFRTRDGHVNIAPTPPMWRRFCAAIGRQDLVAHPDFATPQARRANRDRLNALIEELTSSEKTATLVARFNEAGIPCGPVYSIDQSFADPQTRHLGIAQEVASAALGSITLIGQPVGLSRTPARLARAAPEYGEHIGEILAEFGYSASEIESFRQSGAV